MSEKITTFFRIQFFLLLFSSMAFGQDYIIPPNSSPWPGINIGVVPSQDFVLSYALDANLGLLTLSIKDGEFNNRHFEQYSIGRGFNNVHHEVEGDIVYLLITNSSNFKFLTKINTQNGEVEFFPFSVSLGTIGRFKIFGNSILVVESLNTGDFVQLYDYRTGVLISLSELYYPKTRIWDVQIKDGIFDILVHKKGDFRNQSLKMVGFNAAGSKLYETEILPPGTKKLIFKSAKLIPSGDTGYRIAGTYAKKQGEQFSGYYHVGINDFLEQRTTMHPMRSLEGFFDYKKNPRLRKNAKNLRRDMQVYQTYSSREFVALAASSPEVSRKFVHFIVLDKNGSHIYDTSVKVFYDFGGAFDNSTLALNDKDLYFLFEGNPKINVLPGYKFYQVKDGQLTGLLKAQDYLQVKPNDSEWVEIKYYHWKENKFIVSGIETINGQSKHVIRKIEV
ncbi:hypothetical protein M3O96_14895 [Aquiflexum sp. TKW24L]|uniref:hypothetical protein n=1 Tax=Aquiflexum sp. TKW24L TaxID=2942212 RepID=UPI0020BDFB6B|nr:hypothetical protein [Aquiflexum sp. TKW24L]MCL6260387.1 hypothetical protein [Aquiflexum sp. TKW24L]